MVAEYEGIDPDIATALGQLVRSGAPPMHTVPAERARRAYRRLSAGQCADTCSVSIDTTESRIGGARDVQGNVLSARIYRPLTRAKRPTVVFFHGGGWVIGDLDTHDRMARTLCRYADVVVVSVAYRRAPEHPFPAAYDDALYAVRWAHANIAELGGASQLAVAGDSAGGNLAAATAQTVCENEELTLAGQLLLCPLLDLIGTYPSRGVFAAGPLLDRPTLAWFVRHYAGDCEVTSLAGDRRTSPLAASSLRGVAPAVVAVAEFDPLRDEGEAYAARLARDGVPTELLRLGGMVHGFPDFAATSSAASEALQRVCAAFGAMLMRERTAR